MSNFNAKLESLPVELFLSFCLEKFSKRADETNIIRATSESITGLQRISLINSKFHNALRNKFQSQFVIKLLYPHFFKFESQGYVIGRGQCLPKLILFFSFDNVRILKKIGAFEEKAHEIRIGSGVNYLDLKGLKELPDNFKEVDNLIIERGVYDWLANNFSRHFNRPLERSLEMPFQLAVDCIDETSRKDLSLSWLPKDEDFRFNPQIRKYKTSFYRHRSYGHLGKCIKEEALAYLKKHAPTLKEFEVELPDSERCVLDGKNMFETGHRSPYIQLKNSFRVFHNVLQELENSSIPIRLSFISYPEIKEESPFQPRIHSTTTLEGGRLELGLDGKEPSIVENIPFDEFLNYSDSERLKPTFELFLQKLQSEYNIITE